MRLLSVLVSEVDKLSPEEEGRIWEVVNHSINTYPDLVTPEDLHRCGFGPDPSSSPSSTPFLCVVFGLASFSPFPHFPLFSFLYYSLIYIYILASSPRSIFLCSNKAKQNVFGLGWAG